MPRELFPRIVRLPGQDPAHFGIFIDALVRYQFCRVTKSKFTDAYCEILAERSSDRRDILVSYSDLVSKSLTGPDLYKALLDISQAPACVIGCGVNIAALRKEIDERQMEIARYRAAVSSWAHLNYTQVQSSPRLHYAIPDCVGFRRDGTTELIEFKCSKHPDRSEWWGQLERYRKLMEPREINRLAIINPILGIYKWRPAQISH